MQATAPRLTTPRLTDPAERWERMASEDEGRALRGAAAKARQHRAPVLVVRYRATGRYEYVLAEFAHKLPRGFERWAEVHP